MFFLPLGRRLFSVPRSWSRMMSTAPSDKIISSKIQSISSSPWLMLPPKLNDDENRVTYNFFSLAENRVLTRSHNMTAGGGFGLTNPIHDFRFCGSSHGWVALLNPQSLELFLYDPISHRHINLPPFDHLPNFPKEENHRSVHKLILSSSPDEDEYCRALMIYNCQNTLAFCCPGNDDGGEWTPIGKTPNYTCYDDIAYSTSQNLFFAFNRRHNELETWDLADPCSPRMLNTVNTKKPYRTWDDYEELDEPPKDSLLPHQSHYLVVANENDNIVLLLTRTVMYNVTPDGSYVEIRHTCNDLYPHMTIDFDIRVYDQEEQGHDLIKPLQESARRRRSLGDLALFIGYQSDSVALSATRFPELKPNSIYFTDPFYSRYNPNSHRSFGGHDIGIFDWENKTFSPCYYPCDVRSLKRVAPSPVWFFPRGGSGRLLSE